VQGVQIICDKKGSFLHRPIPKGSKTASYAFAQVLLYYNIGIAFFHHAFSIVLFEMMHTLPARAR
jgi:hypothetical protein